MDLPFLPTPQPVIKRIFYFLNNKITLKGKSLVDLGAGDGRVAIFVAKEYFMQSSAVEINLEMLQTIKDTIAQIDSDKDKLTERIRVIEADLFNFDVSSFDVVYTYPFPKCIRSFIHIFHQMKKGAYMICIRWALEPEQILPFELYDLTEIAQFPVYIYRKG
ncbi:MAG: class I SAM-dependent methyltransferase [Candidatus Lokiarchaeota archaeon]|nr:class I SAM-dependent methyltransferase [Candidatus Harpocratesius repetitus]